jgi:hypothetical protein
MMKKTISEFAGDFSMSGLRRMQAPGNFRAGQQVKGSRGSVASDIQTVTIDSQTELPKVALAYVVEDGKVLAVSRGNDMTNFNMPGGYVEDGEDPKDACVRELWEETGLRAKELSPIYSRAEGGKLITTYKIESYTGDLKSSHEGTPDWVDPHFIMSSQYGDYFKSMLSSSNVKPNE